MKPVCVVPTVRPQLYADFLAAWDEHFRWHGIDVVTVWDGEVPQLSVNGKNLGPAIDLVAEEHRDLFDYSFTDSVRNLGFYYAAANLNFDAVISLDDDTAPLPDSDPIGDHLSVLYKKVPLSWMNTLQSDFFVRGVPYKVRNEGTVHISHGLWRGNLDWDGITQHYLLPQLDEANSAGYLVGPVPKGVYFSFCGMNIACTREALPLMMYCPQGKTTPYNRFGDIWCGINLRRECDQRNWAIYSGASVVNHTRASNVYKNIEAENAGLEINEVYWETPDEQLPEFFREYTRKRLKYKQVLTELLDLGDIL